MNYKIDPNVLEKVCKEVLDDSLEDGAMFQRIRDLLAAECPGLVSTEPRCWIGSRAGGILGKMTVLYASMNEYLIIFGAPASTCGFSGRYNFMEIWDFFLAGETTTCDLESGQVIPRVYQPGEFGHMHKGQSLTCEFKPGSWMIEYGRGPVVTALPFALMDSLVSSVELKSLYLTFKEYGHFVMKHGIV